MAITLLKTVWLDNEQTQVKLVFNHWLPRILKTGGVNLGYSCYFPRMPEGTALVLVAHELIHVHDHYKMSKKIPGGAIFNIAGDLLKYLWQFILAGFRYRNIAEEKYAYANELRVLKGEYPSISAPWLLDLYKQGMSALPKLNSVVVK
jgi:hypothetical protein